jgi:flagellar secretion chaperone FliS
MEPIMFTSVSLRSATAYQRVNVETAVSEASPHQLANMLFEGFLQAVAASRFAMANGDIPSKCKQISKAVRFLEEGLKPALNLEEGGELALGLHRLYGYCAIRLTQANLHNDDKALAEVIRLISPVADSWKQIGVSVAASTRVM